MKNLLLLIALFISFSAVGQSKYNDLKKWPAGKSSTYNGHTIERLEGSNNRHNITNISFESPQQAWEDLEKKAAREMWTPERMEEERKAHSYLKGGYIRLYLERSVIDAANTQWYTIILHDTAGNEVHREQLKAKVASASTPGWYNLGSIVVMKELPSPLRVTVVDQVQSNKHVFLIK
jgi:hypothetical protein